MSVEADRPNSPPMRPDIVEPTTQCRACRSGIVKGAVLCPICKTYQGRILRWVQHSAVIVTAMAVLCGMATYAITHAHEVRRVLWWRDNIDIVALRSVGDITIANVGDGPVVLHSIVIHAKTEGVALNWYSPLESTVEAGTIVHHALSNGTGPGSYVFRQTYGDWLRALTEDARPGGCTTVVYFKANDIFYQELERQAQVTRTPDIRGEATVTWYSAHRGKLFSTTIPVVGALYVGRDCNG